MQCFADIHLHLTHESFKDDVDKVIAESFAAGCKYLVSNGLNPSSNREVLDLAGRHSCVLAGLGIYPTESVNQQTTSNPHEGFDVKEELKWIEEQLKSRPQDISAIGECGLDGLSIPPELDCDQEKVFCELIDLAMRYQKPIIVHSRKREKRCLEILAHAGIELVNMHCYTGKTSLAKEYAEKEGFYFSIPCHIERAENFQKMVRTLPPERLLTETDAPYLSRNKGERAHPKDISFTIKTMAILQGREESQVFKLVYENFCRFIGADKLS